MIRGNKFSTTANIAICAALLCSSPALFAQDVAPAPTAQPTVAAPIAPPTVVQAPPEVAPQAATVAPPPAVRTVPDSQLGEAVAAVPERRATADQPAPRRAAARVTPAVSAVEAPAATPQMAETSSAADFASMGDESATVAGTMEDTAAIAPVDQPATTELTDGTQEDWIIYGGLAAALGLAGLGGLVASRRRRTRQTDIRPVEQAVPVPVENYPAAQPAFVERPAPRVIQPRFADQNLPPVTDPLFAHQAELRPVTDPMFSQKIEMPPVTDPMFADNAEYVGGSTAGAAFDKRRTWNDGPTRELEPAE